MAKFLVPVDGSDNAIRALQYALDQASQHPGTELHVLNVQPPIISGAVRTFIDKATIDGYYEAESMAALQPAVALLSKSGAAYETYKEVGPVAETIAKHAKAHGCDHIIMGTRGLGAFSGYVLGSVTTKTLHLSDVPVTLVK